MYKMAVLDIDGTLVDEKGKISQKTIETIHQVKRKGRVVTLCTGRNIRKTLPIIRKAGIDVPIVCMDGTILYDPIKNKILEDFQLSREEAFSILDYVKEKNTYIEFADGHRYFKYFRSKEYKKYDIFNQHDFLGRIRSYSNGVRYLKKVAEFENIKGPFYQILIASDELTAQQIAMEIKESEMDRVEVRDYLWQGYLFVNRKGIKKSNGVKMLCRHFDIPMEQVIAIGDERNDLDMIEMAGLGIAMGNAVKSVKKAAKEITLKNTEDGVAVALEKYFLLE